MGFTKNQVKKTLKGAGLQPVQLEKGSIYLLAVKMK